MLSNAAAPYFNQSRVIIDRKVELDFDLAMIHSRYAT